MPGSAATPPTCPWPCRLMRSKRALAAASVAAWVGDGVVPAGGLLGSHRLPTFSDPSWRVNRRRAPAGRTARSADSSRGRSRPGTPATAPRPARPQARCTGAWPGLSPPRRSSRRARPAAGELGAGRVGVRSRPAQLEREHEVWDVASLRRGLLPSAPCGPAVGLGEAAVGLRRRDRNRPCSRHQTHRVDGSEALSLFEPVPPRSWPSAHQIAQLRRRDLPRAPSGAHGGDHARQHRAGGGVPLSGPPWNTCDHRSACRRARRLLGAEAAGADARVAHPGFLRVHAPS